MAATLAPTALAIVLCWALPALLMNKKAQKVLTSSPMALHIEFCGKILFIVSLEYMNLYFGFNAMMALLWVLIVGFAFPSGAHLNPLISLSALIMGACNGKTVLAKIAAQFAASVVAALLLRELLPQPKGEVLEGGTDFMVLGMEAFASALSITGPEIVVATLKPRPASVVVASIVVALVVSTKAVMDPAGAVAGVVHKGCLGFNLQFVQQFLASFAGAVVGSFAAKMMLKKRPAARQTGKKSAVTKGTASKSPSTKRSTTPKRVATSPARPVRSKRTPKKLE